MARFRRAEARPPVARGEALRREVYALVRSIPRGKVVTYGQIAELIGQPGAQRLVAAAMRGCPPELPWQRVVARRDRLRGYISIHDPEHAALQRALLAAEGVGFDARDCIALRRWGWLPG